jgi:hypothetical protein
MADQYFIKKIITCKALDVDTKTKSVKIAIAETETIDHDGDLILPTAAIKTLKERGPQGTNEIWHLLDHTAKSFSALSKFSEMGMYGKYIGGVSKYKDSFAWREVAWPLYEAGDFTQHSIAFRTIDEKQMNGYNEIREIQIFEGSAVLWGANPYTPTLEITKALGFDPAKDSVLHRIERLSKSLSLGKYEDDSHRELMVIELQQLKQDIFDLIKSTGPGKNSTQPELAKEYLTAIKTFRNSLKN